MTRPISWQRERVRKLIVHHASGPSPTCDERNIASAEEWGLLKTTAITWDKGWNASAHKVPPSVFWGNKAIEVHAGDVLVTKAGPRNRCGVTAYVLSTPPRLMVSGKMILLRPDTSKIDTVVLASALATEECQRYLDSRTTGMADAQLNFTNELLLDTVITFPSLPEQHKIARILTTVDSLIEKTEALIAKYHAIKQGMIHDLFTRGVDEHGQLRPPYAEAPHLYKETELGWVPKEWSISSVHNEFNISTGFTLGPHRRPGRNARLYLRVANVQRDSIVLDDVAELDATHDEYIQRRLEENDLLIVEGHADPNEIGRCARVTSASIGLTFQNHLFRLRVRAIDPRFACEWLNSSLVRKYWYDHCATSSGLNTINQKMLRGLQIVLPPSTEQARIVGMIYGLKQTIWKEQSLLVKLRAEKTALMQDLLTGKVRVKVDKEAEAHV